jgi:hypothetical protein
MTQMCIFYLLGTEDGDADVCAWHTSQLMFSLSYVSNVQNYLNVWSGSIMLFPLKHRLIMSKRCDPFIYSLFCRVKMVSARSSTSLSA